MVKKYPFNKKSILCLPERFAVYIFYGTGNIPIYIGKANSLKNRLRTYLNPKMYEKTDKLVSNIKKYSYILVDSEVEALLLEAKLIKKYMPRYNVLCKDGKSPLYITITNDVYPLLAISRKPGKNYKYIYGPFLSRTQIIHTLRLIRKVIPYSTHAPSKRPCIYKQMGLCNPCPSDIAYCFSKKQKLKLNNNYRKNIRKLKMFLDGKLKRLENELYQSMLKCSIEQKYEEANIYKNQLSIISSLQKPTANVELYTKDPYYLSKVINTRLTLLKRHLSKHLTINNLKRIECYDISHISGVSSAGSMVVFINGTADKKEYRRFKIKYSSNNDIASLAEVAKRRAKHLKEWGKPDLIVVDGGKAQTNVFKNVFGKYNIAVIGIAKRNETIIIPKNNGGYEKILPKDEALLLIQSIRNESHRFAVFYHRKLMSKTLLQSDRIKI